MVALISVCMDFVQYALKHLSCSHPLGSISFLGKELNTHDRLKQNKLYLLRTSFIVAWTTLPKDRPTKFVGALFLQKSFKRNEPSKNLLNQF